MDVSRWNLLRSGVGLAVAVIACGPTPGDAEGGDSNDATSASTGASDVGETNSTQGGDCLSDADCGYGYACVNNICEYQCHCGCGQPPPPGFDVRCPGGPGTYYDCYSDYDCGAGQVCDYGECLPAPIDCAEIPVVGESFVLEFSSPDALPIAALAFGDVAATPGAELLVARGNTIEMMGEGIGAVIVQTPTDVVAFAVADVDGDARVDLVTAEAGETALLRLWHGNEDGTFTDSELAQPLVGARALAVGDRQGDLQADVYAHVGGDVLLFPNVGGVPLGAAEPILGGQIDSMALIDVGSDAVSDVAFGEGSGFWLYREVQGPAPMAIGEAGGGVIDVLVAADFSGDGEPDLAGFARPPAAMMTFTGLVPTHAEVAFALSEGGYASAAAGDIDGDGRQDLAILEPELGSVLVRYGADVGPEVASEPYRCDTRYAIEIVGERISVGDSDGDGRAELAVAGGALVALVRI